MKAQALTPPYTIKPQQVCAVVLAGGRAERMGGVDKGLQPFRGQALALHALNRLRAQSGGAPGCVGINANRNAALYAAWGCPVWADVQGDFPGPLAGFLAGLQYAKANAYAYLLTVPCDSPLFPLDLLSRMATALGRTGADIALAHGPESQPDGKVQLRSQPVFCLLDTRLEASLQNFMGRGKRKIEAWTAEHHTVPVPFDAPGDLPQAFANTNTLLELSALERL